nr:MerR family transcriptional regulator [Tsuneonella aeria]
MSAALGIKPHVLRYWEDQFPMLKPLKRSGARRYYRAADVALVQEIDRLVNREGYTLRGARTALKDFRAGAAPSGATSAEPLEHASLFDTPRAPSPPSGVPSDIETRLRAIRQKLSDAMAQ